MQNNVIISSLILGLVFLTGCSQQSVNSVKPTSVVEQSTKSVETKQTTSLTTSETGAWKTYKSDLGFSFDYPTNWSCEIIMHDDNTGGVGCSEISRKKAFDHIPDKMGDEGYYENDLRIQFSGYQAMDEYLQDPTTQKIGKIMLGNKSAYDIIIGGFSENYGIVTELDGKILELSFLSGSKSGIGDIEKHIISSFRFTK